jgi:hypothetical protein
LGFCIIYTVFHLFALAGPIRGGGAAEGAIFPGPQNLENKKNIDISNGLRKNFLNLNFANIGPKKGFYQCNLRRICREKIFWKLQ